MRELDVASLPPIGSGGQHESVHAAWWADDGASLTFTGAPRYAIRPLTPVHGRAEIDATTGLFTFSPAAGDAGRIEIQVYWGLPSDTVVPPDGYPYTTLILSPRAPEVDDTRALAPSSHRTVSPQDYVWTEEWSGDETFFNNDFRQVRTVTVSAVALEIGSATSPLSERLRRVEDIDRLVLVADSLAIAGEVRLPEAEVCIYARTLAFTGGGSIDTSATADEVIADECQTGHKGASGGSITLCVDGITGVPRFRASGAAGQRGGNGRTGTRRVFPTYPVEDKSIDVPNFWKTTISIRVKDSLKDATARNVLAAAVRVDYFNTYVADPEEPFSQHFAMRNGEHDWGKWPPDLSPIKASEPAGQGGPGGNGGTLSAPGPLIARCGLAASCTALPGGPGQNGTAATRLTPDNCATPRNPGKAKLVWHQGFWEINSNMDVAQLEAIDAAPSLVTPPEPLPAAGGTGGTVVEHADGWCHPTLAARVADHVRRLHQAGDTEAARTLAAVYSAAMQSDDAVRGFDAADYAAARAVCRDVQAKLDAGVDAFGRPPSWVPMLSLDRAKDLYETTIDGVIPILCFARWVSARHETLSSAAEEWGAAVETLVKRRRELVTSHNQALQSLDGIRAEVQSATADQEDRVRELLQKEIELTQDVARTLQAKAIFQGALNILSGVLQLVPIGQPATGMAGQGLKLLGSIDSSKSVADNLKTMKEDGLNTLASSAVKKLATAGGDRLDAMVKQLDEQHGALKTRRGDELKRKLDRDGAREKQRKAVEEGRNKTKEKVLGDFRQESNLPGNASEETVLQALQEKGSLDRYRQALRREQEKRARASKSDAELQKTWKAEDEALERNAAERQAPLKDLSSQLEAVSAQAGSAIGDVLTGIGKLSVPQSAIDAELAHVKESCPAYVALVEKVKTASGRLGEAARRLVNALGRVQSTISELIEVHETIARLNRMRDGALKALDPGVLAHFKAMERDAVARLAQVQYYLVKAYEYRVLQPCPAADFLLDELDEKLKRLFAASTRVTNVDDAVAASGRMFTQAEIDSTAALYRAQLAGIVAGIVEYVARNDVASTDENLIELDDRQLAALNTVGETSLNPMEWAFDPNFQNVRVVRVTIDETTQPGIELAGAPGASVQVKFRFVHSGLSVLRDGDTLYAFNTTVRERPSDTGETHGRTWSSTAERSGADGGTGLRRMTTRVENHAPDPQANALLDAVGTKVPSYLPADQASYTAPALWTTLRLHRTVMPPELSGAIRVTRLRLRLHTTGITTQNDHVRTMMVLANAGLRPSFEFDVDDSMTRAGGRPLLFRSYSRGRTVNLRAPERCAGLPFQYWEWYRFSGEAGSRVPSRELAVEMNGHHWIRAMYGYLGPVVSGAGLVKEYGYAASGGEYVRHDDAGSVIVDVTAGQESETEEAPVTRGRRLRLVDGPETFEAIAAVDGFTFDVQTLTLWSATPEGRRRLGLLRRAVPAAMLTGVAREIVHESEERTEGVESVTRPAMLATLRLSRRFVM